MALLKDVKGFGLPWEESYGFAQAVKVGDTIYVLDVPLSYVFDAAKKGQQPPPFAAIPVPTPK